MNTTRNEDLGAIAREAIASMNIDRQVAEGFDRVPRFIHTCTPTLGRPGFAIVDRNSDMHAELQEFANDSMCEPWQPDSDPLIDTDAIARGEAPGTYSPYAKPGMFVATAEGVVSVDADIESDTLADMLLEDGVGTASWLWGERTRLHDAVCISGPIHPQFRVWLSEEAESAEYIDERGHIDAEHCTLVLQLDGEVVLKWNQLTAPADIEHLFGIAIGVSTAVYCLESDARAAGRREVAEPIRKALGL